nr:MAG TPA: hypothetical protein [Caudoviricetes sp.]
MTLVFIIFGVTSLKNALSIISLISLLFNSPILVPFG